MRSQTDLHLVPNIGPIWMMLMLLGEHGHAGHKGERLRKILERKGSAELIVFFFPRHDVDVLMY